MVGWLTSHGSSPCHTCICAAAISPYQPRCGCTTAISGFFGAVSWIGQAASSTRPLLVLSDNEHQLPRISVNIRNVFQHVSTNHEHFLLREFLPTNLRIAKPISSTNTRYWLSLARKPIALASLCLRYLQAQDSEDVPGSPGIKTSDNCYIATWMLRLLKAS